MERDGGDLEEQAGGRCQQCEDDDRIVGPGRENLLQSFGNLSEVGAAGQSVEQRQAVGEDAGRECAQQQIFQRSFIRAFVATQEADKHVGRDGHQFQADEQQHEVIAGGHAHHADDGEQQQRIELAVVLLLDLQVANRHEDRDRRAGEEQIREVDGEGIDQQRSHEAGVGKCQALPLRDVISPLQLADGGGRECDTDQRDVGVHALPLLRQKQVDQQDAEREQRQQQHGQRQQVIRSRKELC